MNQFDARPPTWKTIEQVARRVADDYNNIVGFVCEDRIPYRYHEDGIEIWWEGFRMVMPELYDLAADLRTLCEAAKFLSEADVHSLLTDYTRRDERKNV